MARRIKTRLRVENRNSEFTAVLRRSKDTLFGEICEKRKFVLFTWLQRPRLQREIAEWHHHACKNPRFRNFVKSDILRCLVKFRVSKCISRVVTGVEGGKNLRKVEFLAFFLAFASMERPTQY